MSIYQQQQKTHYNASMHVTYNQNILTMYSMGMDKFTGSTSR